MQDKGCYIKRSIELDLCRDLGNFPAVAIIGPRQAGKSTLAKALLDNFQGAQYLDLEYPPDLEKLTQAPELFLAANAGKLICLDEIQRVPEIFPVLRSVIDRQGVNGQFLILGSASPELLRQSSESLAGRIIYRELTALNALELGVKAADGLAVLRKYWLRGGFPRSYLAADEQASLSWRRSFITTFLERDIPGLGVNIPAATLRRLWTMLAHLHGQLLNASRLGQNLGFSHPTIRRHIELLQKTFMIRVLPPCLPNLGKRLVKSPKLYIRDSGILAALLGIADYNELLGHPVFGASWEGLCLENICTALPNWQPSFYRTSDGSEIDLVLELGTRRLAFEFKASLAPRPGPGFNNAVTALQPEKTWVIYPGTDMYPLRGGVWAAGLGQVLEQIAHL